eukprot:scaffold88027_cov72-Phaeocystis_antarctica.AAC.1
MRLLTRGRLLVSSRSTRPSLRSSAPGTSRSGSLRTMLRDQFSGSEILPQSGVRVLRAFTLLVGAS